MTSREGSKSPIKNYRIAMTIILSSFIIISSMLAIHYATGRNFETTFQDPKIDNSTKSKALEAFEQVDKSNQTVFNILLPVFGAWVGAVVAFYFGSSSLAKVQESADQAQSSYQNTIASLISKNPGLVTLEKLLELYPSSKDIQRVKLSNTIKNVKEKGKRFGNVVVESDDDTVFGVLYPADLPDGIDENEKLGDIFGTVEIIDHITNKKWDKSQKLENYAVLSYQDTISKAKQLMESVKPETPDVLGVVIVDQKAVAAINYQTLARSFTI